MAIDEGTLIKEQVGKFTALRRSVGDEFGDSARGVGLPAVDPALREA